jgi:TonB family protein
MKWLLLVTVWFLGSLTSLFGSSDPAAQHLLASAKHQADIFNEKASPFQLDVDFVAQINIPTKGYMILKWEAKDRWWRKVVMGDYGQIEIRNGEKLFILRNKAFTPLHVLELINLLAFSQESEGLIVTKTKSQLENGVASSCMAVQKERSKSGPHKVCIDPFSREILSDEWLETPDVPNREQFTDYFDFGGRRFPRKLQLRDDTSVALSANVTSLKTIAFDEALLVPPQGAIERRKCANMTTPVLLNKVKIPYPFPDRRSGNVGDTIASLTVLADGAVEDIQLISRAGHTMDEAALKNMKRWRFMPALCGTEPVVSEVEAIVSFRESRQEVRSSERILLRE